MEEISIQKADLTHMPAVAGVLRRSFRHTYPSFPELHTPEEDIDFFINVVFPKDEVYIAEDDSGTIVGFIAFDKEMIDHLYLLPEAQRQGIGSELLRIALAHSNHLRLWTFQQNLPAQAFYAKHGFQAIEWTDGAGNEEKQPDVLFERKV
jgi:ribosomal protein S18 acetylase RimI-like enzyme